LIIRDCFAKDKLLLLSKEGMFKVNRHNLFESQSHTNHVFYAKHDGTEHSSYSFEIERNGTSHRTHGTGASATTEATNNPFGRKLACAGAQNQICSSSQRSSMAASGHEMLIVAGVFVFEHHL
jgi:hypothetical protein